MDYYSLLSVCLFIALIITPFTTSTVSTLDSCPDHCYCFVVSRNAPPPTALLSSYIQANDWEDGSKAIACWGRKDIPQPIAPDLKYLVLIGSQKPKRRLHKDERFGLRPRSMRGSLSLRRPRTFVIPDPTSARRRNIRSVPQGAFSGLREIIQLDLHGNKIMELGPTTYQGLSNLRVINMNENRIKSLHPLLLHDAHALRTFLVSGNFLRSIPENIFRNNRHIERLDLSDNILWSIGEDCFQPLGALKFLNLSFNRVNERNQMVFTGLSQLTELYLQRNKFTRIDPTLFLSNTQLEKIDLSFNRIKTIAENAFQNQGHLEVLDLSGNALTSLNSLTFRGVSSLRTLDLSFNNINEIMDDVFSSLTNLTKLYMKHNSLTHITRDIFGDIPSLTYLTLAENDISQIASNSMAGLVGLEYLDLSGNNLNHLQARAFQGLEGLMELNLADNRLYIIEPEAFRTTQFSFKSQLSWLNLQGNQLMELQRGVFRGVPSLRVLTLSKNKISRIVPEAFSGFNRLHRLMMSDNSLVRLPDGTFRFLRTLEMLDLRNNSLSEIGDKAFQGLDALSNLNLAHNELTSDKMKWLKHIQSVQTLNLMGNHFTHMSSDDFEIAGNLRYLHLSNNNLTKVSITNDSRLYLYNLTLSNNLLTELQDFPSHVLRGRVLDLAGNPWNCNCRLVRYLTDMTRRHGIRFDKEYQTRCKTPGSLRGVKVMDLIRSDDVSCRGEDLVNVPVIAVPSTPTPNAGHTPSLSNYMAMDRLRWSWVALIWDSATDTPTCNGALMTSNFVLTSYECLMRITDIKSYLRLVSECPQPLGGDCQDKAWTAPSNLEVKVSAGQGTLRNFLLVAETYRVQRIHKVLPDMTPDGSSTVLLQISPSVDLQSVSLLEILGEKPTFGQLDGKRVLAAGWWIDRSKAPEVDGRQKRRHYRVMSSQCGSANDVHQPYLCGHLEQALDDYKGWDCLGSPVTIRERNRWKLVGILLKNEEDVGYIKDVRQAREEIQRIIATKPRMEHVNHPF